MTHRTWLNWTREPHALIFSALAFQILLNRAALFMSGSDVCMEKPHAFLSFCKLNCSLVSLFILEDRKKGLSLGYSQWVPSLLQMLLWHFEIRQKFSESGLCSSRFLHSFDPSNCFSILIIFSDFNLDIKLFSNNTLLVYTNCHIRLGQGVRNLLLPFPIKNAMFGAFYSFC